MFYFSQFKIVIHTFIFINLNQKNFLKMLSKIVCAYHISNVLAAEPNPPTWDTNRVKIFTPGQADAQA